MFSTDEQTVPLKRKEEWQARMQTLISSAESMSPSAEVSEYCVRYYLCMKEKVDILKAKIDLVKTSITPTH